MPTAKLFKHGGSQAMRIPKAFRLKGAEVTIKKCGAGFTVQPMRKRRFKTLNDVARYFAKKYPGAHDFPDIERPKHHERPIPDLS